VIDECREKIPGTGLANDSIAGYCRETDEEFEETSRLLEEIRYQNVFVFRYSERSGTDAAKEPDDVPEDVKRERNQALLDLQATIGHEVRRRAVGETVEVLVEGPSKTNASRWAGRDRRHRIVVFALRPGEDLVGELVDVRITEATALTLIGERAVAAP